MRLRFPRLDRATFRIVIVAVVLGALLMVAATWVESRFAETVPSSSALSRSATGLSAWHDYLARLGLRPQLLTDFSSLPATGTLVVAAPFENEPTDADATALAAWVRAGGRLVLVGSEATAFAEKARLLTTDVTGASARSSAAVPVLPSPLSTGVGSIATGPSGTSIFEGTQWVPLFSDGHGTAVAARPFGRGRIVWLLDAMPVSNEGIGRADDAAFAVRLALSGGPAPVYFDEYHHGLSTSATPWTRLGPGGQASLLLLVAAAGVLLLAWGRRLGPAIAPTPRPAARGSAYIAQLAELYRAAGARGDALGTLEDGLSRAIARRYGTKDVGLARQPHARDALARSAALRLRGKIERSEFVTTAALLRAARDEVEGGNG